MNEFVKLFIWVVVIGAVFAFLWWQGYLVRIANYVRETQEELKKCSWPTWEELKGSTVVVMVSIALLGAFTMGVDTIIGFLVKFIS
ncbi:MAG: preprotein translocase subunit SecE [Verrucomicrobiota bacterium]